MNILFCFYKLLIYGYSLFDPVTNDMVSGINHTHMIDGYTMGNVITNSKKIQ